MKIQAVSGLNNYAKSPSAVSFGVNVGSLKGASKYVGKIMSQEEILARKNHFAKINAQKAARTEHNLALKAQKAEKRKMQPIQSMVDELEAKGWQA